MSAYLSDDALERSGVVANCRMNRERTLTGSNGYSKDLGFNPWDLLKARLGPQSRGVRWLDLCCGSGNALIEAAGLAHAAGLDERVEIIGVDLVGMFSAVPINLRCLQLVTAGLASWEPQPHFDLITCVHGLHYIGDKLGLIARAAAWLGEDGRFVGSLDLKNIKLHPSRSAGRLLAQEFRRQSLQYDPRRKLINCEGRREVSFPLRYLGADDQAGPNSTGQPAVNSHYELIEQGA